MADLDLPPGVRLVTPRPAITACLYCHGAIDTGREQHVTADVRLDGDTAWKLAPTSSIGVVHVHCWRAGKFIVSVGAIRGWDCSCCSCPADEPPLSYTCRNHGAGHDQDGCARHRQPAQACADTCCRPDGAA